MNIKWNEKQQQQHELNWDKTTIKIGQKSKKIWQVWEEGEYKFEEWNEKEIEVRI